ncbi:MAG: ATP-binding protein [Prochloraceae cyanobacterium]|nr:ATP-binding protein [Prochloraceae cyanobacterium]
MKTATVGENIIDWQNLGAELVYTQDYSGKYLSFYWQAALDYGLTEEKVAGFSLRETIAPVALEDYYQRIKRVIERRNPEKFYCYLHYQGQTFPFELVISPIFSGDSKVNSVLVMGHRLSQKETAIAHKCLTLDRCPDFYRKLLSQISRDIRRTLNIERIWQQTVDRLGQQLCLSRCLIISYNSKKKRLKVEAEYRQKSFESMLESQFDLDSQIHWKQAIASTVPIAIEYLVPETYKQKSVLTISIGDKDGTNGLICLQQCDRHRHWTEAEIDLIQEIADRVGVAIAHAKLYRELEQAKLEAEEASRLKSNFLTSTTHELRTPLTGIIGFLKLIVDGMADDYEEQKEFIEEAYNSALYLLNLINDILDIAKIEAGKMELELAAVDLDDLLNNVENFIRPQAESKNLSFKIKRPSTLTPVIIYGNYQRLLQVMLNLLGNAIKFTAEGGIQVTAEIRKNPTKIDRREFPGTVKISVADTGIGVSLEKQQMLFDNFFQVDGSRTKAYAGTGLGLGISQKLVEAMGGEISFYSMGEGLGSTVTFSVPLYHLPVTETKASTTDSIELAS